jgi:hypothetical protein
VHFDPDPVAEAHERGRRLAGTNVSTVRCSAMHE